MDCQNARNPEIDKYFPAELESADILRKTSWILKTVAVQTCLKSCKAGTEI